MFLVSVYFYRWLYQLPLLGGGYADEERLADVTVVGSKTGANRQDFATSVGYFGVKRLEMEPISNIDDVFARSANVNVGTTGFGAYSIRGIKNGGISTTFSNANSLASILVDQVAMGLNSGDYVRPSMFDVESVEILRGPQSLFGPNALIGSVYVNHKQAEFGNSDGQVRIEAGELGTQNLALAQNYELITGYLAGRLVVEARDSDGDVTNTSSGDKDVQRTDEDSARLMFKWRPQGTDDLELDISYWDVDSDSNPFALSVAPPGGKLFDRKQPYNVRDKYPYDFNRLALTVNWQINDSLRLTSITGSSELDLKQQFDGDLSSAPMIMINGLIKEDLFSQEFHLNYDAANFHALLGLFYSDGEYKNGFNGSGTFMGTPFNRLVRNTEDVEQVAIFSKLDYRLGQRFTLSAGLRLNREDRKNNNYALNFGVVSDLKASKKFNQIIPSASLSYDIFERTSVGVSYARGFQAGGVAFAMMLNRSASYDEEFTDNYELFLRHVSDDGRWLFNANVFYIDWTDQQVPYTVAGGQPGFDDLIANVGKSTLKGAEIEVEFEMTDDLSSFLSVGIIDSEFKRFILNNRDYKGKSFPQSPDYNMSLGMNYDHISGWFANATFSYVDHAYTDLGNPKLSKMSDRNILDGRFGYQTQGWRVYLWGKNLLDDEYELGLFDGTAFGFTDAYGRLAAPRTIGVGLNINW